MSKQTNAVGMVFAIVVMVAAHAGVARAEEPVVAHVPFAFIVGESRLPAGDYIVKELDGDPGVISVTRTDRHQSSLTLTMALTSPGGRLGQPRLVFDKFEDQYFLARVVRDDGDEQEIVLTPAIMEREAATAR